MVRGRHLRLSENSHRRTRPPCSVRSNRQGVDVRDGWCWTRVTFISVVTTACRPCNARWREGLAAVLQPLFPFLARDVIYTSHAYATMSVSVCLSVRLSVTEVHWRIIANLSFKFRSKFTAHCGRGACGREGRDHRREELRDHLALC